jgi:hypothetical protein
LKIQAPKESSENLVNNTDIKQKKESLKIQAPKESSENLVNITDIK